MSSFTLSDNGLFATNRSRLHRIRAVLASAPVVLTGFTVCAGIEEERMVRKLCVSMHPVSDCGAASAQDARSALQNAVKALAPRILKTIQYSGTGWDSSVGQSYN